MESNHGHEERTSALEDDTQTQGVLDGDSEARDMLFETDPAAAVAEHQHKRSKTVVSKDPANKNRNMNKKLSTHQRDMLFYQLTQKGQSQKENGLLDSSAGNLFSSENSYSSH